MISINLYFRYVGLGILATFFLSCHGKDKVSATEPLDQATLALIEKGEGLIMANCYSCHSPSSPLEGGRLAPPMKAVKSHYLDEETTLEEFTKDLIRFVHQPSEGYSKMPGARRRFGLMPGLPLPQEELKAIAAFIYHKGLEAPAWLKAHQQGELDTPQAYAQKGRALALQTKAILGKNLMAAINAGGPENAIKFCNTRAISLTDSSSNVLNALRIRRVTDRPRNPVNAADSLQLVQLEYIRNDLEQGKTEVYRLDEAEGTVTAYYPIMTEALCLQCHGEKETNISLATMSALEALYPEDQATGYATKQLRGIWVVTMARN